MGAGAGSGTRKQPRRLPRRMTSHQLAGVTEDRSVKFQRNARFISGECLFLLTRNACSLPLDRESFALRASFNALPKRATLELVLRTTL
jgi:hypothetical protein